MGNKVKPLQMSRIQFGFRNEGKLRRTNIFIVTAFAFPSKGDLSCWGQAFRFVHTLRFHCFEASDPTVPLFLFLLPH